MRSGDPVVPSSGASHSSGVQHDRNGESLPDLEHGALTKGTGQLDNGGS
jgi:hypothetical protein